MSVFPEVDFPTQFRAIGLVKGSYSPTSEFEGILTLENGNALIANVGSLLKSRRNKRGNWLDKASGIVHCWKVYPRTDGAGNLSMVELKSSHTMESAFWQQANQIMVRGLIVQEIEGETRPSSLKVEIRPNQEPRRKKQKAFTIVIRGESLPFANQGEFWEVISDVVDGKLIYASGECIDKEYELNHQVESRKSTLLTERDLDLLAQKVKSWFDTLDSGEYGGVVADGATPQQSTNSIVSVSKVSSKVPTREKIKETTCVPISNQTLSQPVASDIIMINGRAPELIVKFSTRPDIPETGKKVTLQVNSDNGISVRATLNRKTLKKQVDKMDSFDEWVGALSGQMSAIDLAWGQPR